MFFFNAFLSFCFSFGSKYFRVIYVLQDMNPKGAIKGYWKNYGMFCFQRLEVGAYA